MENFYDGFVPDNSPCVSPRKQNQKYMLVLKDVYHLLKAHYSIESQDEKRPVKQRATVKETKTDFGDHKILQRNSEPQIIKSRSHEGGKQPNLPEENSRNRKELPNQIKKGDSSPE